MVTPLGILQTLALLIAVGGFYALFYTHVVAKWGFVVRPLVRLLGRQGRHSARDLDALGKLGAAAVAQAAFAAVLLASIRFDLRTVVGVPTPLQVMLGIGLGVAELGCSAFLGTLALKAALAVGGGQACDWLGTGRGGWMGQFLAAGRAAPPWLFAPIVLAYVVGEEVIFRVVLIEALRPFGAVIAIVTSSAWFVGVQALHMPTMRSALFPMAGGFVVGFVHSIIYWQAPEPALLALAHATFFGGALFWFGGIPSAGRAR